MTRGRIGALALAAASLLAAGAARAEEVKTPDYTFSYDYPTAARAIPALRGWFEADRRARQARIARDAASSRRDAVAGKFTFRPHEIDVGWQVVTETSRFLSLSGSAWGYTGGAHGNAGSMALVWDKAGRRRLDPVAVFTSPSALERAIRPGWCRALNAARAEKRGEPVKPGSTEMFDVCPALKELTLLLGSTDRRAIDRVGLIADAYVAGPYVEGPYEVTLPVTPALLAAVKLEYRGAFRAR